MINKNKRRKSRKRKHRHALIIKITAVLLIIPVLIASGIFAYLYTHPVSLKKSVIEHEQ